MKATSHDELRYRRPLLRICGWLGVFALLGAGPLLASESPARFNAVKSWRGSFIASAHQDTFEEYPGHGGTVKIFYNCYFMADLLLDEFEDDPAVWRGRLINPQMDSHFRGVSRKVLDAKEGNFMDEVEFFDTSGPPLTGGSPPELLFHRERGWSFHFGTPGRPAQLSEEITVISKKQGVVAHEQRQKEVRAAAESGTATLPYPAKGLILFAGDKKSERGMHIPSSLAGDIAWEYTIYLEPASLEELRLEIDEPADYATWRPETTPKRERGKPLEVTANLVTATGGKPQTRVESFIWELVNTSREPGVALNFPLDQITDDPDLELDASGEFFVLSKENQRMERAVREGFTDNVKVVPFDWGGWSTLQVTAVLADGRRVMGKLKGKSERGIRIPKRDPNSHIADGWKAKNKSGADDLDDEDAPEGDGHKGDGFALYEEYRGFVIEGEHVEGDPKAKDFFVLNFIKDDAKPGIALFASLSGFHVHTTTRDTEISFTARLMNGNHSEGARVVDQHSVTLNTYDSVEELGGAGGYTFSDDKGVSFRPGTTKGIGILKRGFADSDFSKPFNLRAEDALGAYDRAIAHELLHSVGAVHHGKGDEKIHFNFIAPRNRRNGVGRPYFSLKGDEAFSSPEPAPLLELLDEDKHDVAATVYPRYAKALGQYASTFRRAMIGDPGDPGYPKMTEEEFESYCDSCVCGAFSLNGLIGVEGGPHSGDQNCIMRYYFADFYPMKAPGKGYYRIALGAERIGSTLCRSQEGTGVNAPSHDPQSRHGNAPTGAGNCAAQISPNDLVLPRPTPY
jgi:hypothetical protein